VISFLIAKLKFKKNVPISDLEVEMIIKTDRNIIKKEVEMTKQEKQSFTAKYNKFWLKLGVEDAAEFNNITRMKKNKDGSVTVTTWTMRQIFHRTTFKELSNTLKEIGPFEEINKEDTSPKWKLVDRDDY